MHILRPAHFAIYHVRDNQIAVDIPADSELIGRLPAYLEENNLMTCVLSSIKESGKSVHVGIKRCSLLPMGARVRIFGLYLG